MIIGWGIYHYHFDIILLLYGKTIVFERDIWNLSWKWSILLLSISVISRDKPVIFAAT